LLVRTSRVIAPAAERTDDVQALTQAVRAIDVVEDRVPERRT